LRGVVVGQVVGLLKQSMVARATGESGDWVMVRWGKYEHAWILAQNRGGVHLLVKEMDE
jgi:hypothetical protein